VKFVLFVNYGGWGVSDRDNGLSPEFLLVDFGILRSIRLGKSLKLRYLEVINGGFRLDCR
jgi:hypothetical protein